MSPVQRLLNRSRLHLSRDALILCFALLGAARGNIHRSTPPPRHEGRHHSGSANDGGDLHVQAKRVREALAHRLVLWRRQRCCGVAEVRELAGLHDAGKLGLLGEAEDGGGGGDAERAAKNADLGGDALRYGYKMG